MRRPSPAAAVVHLRPLGALLVLAAVASLAAACAGGAPSAIAAPIPPRDEAALAGLRPAGECAPLRARAREAQWHAADELPRSLRVTMPDDAPTREDGGAVSEYVLSYLVNAAGRVDRETIALSPNVGAWYLRELRRVAPGWRFRPATLERCAVPYAMVDTVRMQGVR